MHWCCEKTQSPACVTYTDPEDLNMVHPRVDTIGTDKYSVPGQETVRIQAPVGTQGRVSDNDMQYAFASALLDQLDSYGADVNEHYRRLRNKQYSAKPQIEAASSLEIQNE